MSYSPRLRELLARAESPRERLVLLWDFAIIALVTVDLVLIVFDAVFSIGPVGAGLGALWPAGHDWYQHAIHRHFVTIDLGFVAVFVIDVLVGWALAIAERRYYRWFFYPFVHWYDVLGCIPVAGFRFLRVLRLISLIIRLQRLGAIDIRNWAIYRGAIVYYEIVAEEISDRVVVKVLSGVQDELRSGGTQLTRQVVAEVIEPRRESLVRAISAQLEDAITSAYRVNRAELRAYIARVVHHGVDGNPALQNLERVPMLGSFVSQALNQAINDTVNNVLDEAVAGLSSRDFDILVHHLLDSAISRILNDEIGQAAEIRDAVVEILELVKNEVAVRRWHAYFQKTKEGESANERK